MTFGWTNQDEEYPEVNLSLGIVPAYVRPILIQLMVNCWFGMVVWIPRIPWWKGFFLRGTPSPSQQPKPPIYVSWLIVMPLPNQPDFEEDFPFSFWVGYASCQFLGHFFAWQTAYLPFFLPNSPPPKKKRNRKNVRRKEPLVTSPPDVRCSNKLPGSTKNCQLQLAF